MADITTLPTALDLTLAQPAPVVAVAVTAPVLVLSMALGLNEPTINITDGVESIVTNTRNFAVSEYSNFAFNSMAKFNGKYVYARSDGIYEAGGTDDNGVQIDAGYKTGAIDLYATEVQKPRDTYLTFRSDGDIQFFAEGDEAYTRIYNIANSVLGRIHERRVKFERGIRDRYFNFGVSNVNGSTFEMKSVKVLSEPIRKRR